MPRSPVSDDGTLITLGIVGVAAALGVTRAGLSGSRAEATDRSFLAVPVKTRAQARAFLKKLVEASLDFHLEDNPADIIVHRTGEALFTEAELPEVQARVNEVFRYLDDPFEDLLALTDRRDLPRIWKGGPSGRG